MHATHQSVQNVMSCFLKGFGPYNEPELMSSKKTSCICLVRKSLLAYYIIQSNFSKSSRRWQSGPVSVGKHNEKDIAIYKERND